MDIIINLILFWIISIIGYHIFKKLKVPAPAILGPVILIALMNIMGFHLSVTTLLKPVLSIIMGIILGLRFNLRIKELIWQVFFVIVWLIGLTVLAFYVLNLSGVDAATALFAATPGGLAEISLISLSYGTDSFAVALLQSSRLIVTMLVSTALINKVAQPVSMSQKTVKKEERKEDNKILWIMVLTAAAGLAVLLKNTGVPAGAMLGPMIIMGIYCKAKDVHIKINRTLQSYVQIGVGGLVGLSITKESVMGIGNYIVPILVLNILVIGGSILLALLLHKFAKWNLGTCILATCPAGLSPTIILSMDYEVNTNIVTVFQVLRLVTVLITTPLIAHLLL